MKSYIEIQRKHLIPLLLIVAILFSYYRVINFDFVGYDDKIYVTKNDHLHSGFTRESMAWAFTFNKSGYWQPLTWLSHMLDIQLFGLDPGMHHLTNLLLHMLNTLLLFFTLIRMSKAFWQCAFVAGLFALHPLNVESVAWVAARKTLLSTFFWIMTLLAYSYYTERPGIKRYFLPFTTFALGLMAKPMLVTLPFVLLLLDYWPLCRFQSDNSVGLRSSKSLKSILSYLRAAQVFRLFREKVPFLVISAVSVFLSALSAQHIGVAVSLKSVPMHLRIANAVVAYVRYLEKMILPGNLTVFYPYPESLPLWQPLSAGILVAVISVLVFWQSRSKPYLTVGWLWYIGTLVPVIGLVQAGIWPAMADRFAYVPLIGLFILIAWGTADIFAKWSLQYKNIVLFASAGALFSTLMIHTSMQVAHWKNGITLFEHAIKVTDNNYVAHNNLAITLSDQGKINEAIYHYEEVVRVRPNNAGALFNLGNAFYDHKSLDKAAVYYNKALKIDPAHAGAHNNLANLLFTQGKYEKAVAQYAEVLKENPDDIGARINLANVLFAMERLDEAILLYNEVLKSNPKEADAHFNLGSLLLNKGEAKSAMRHFAETIKIDPGYAKAYHQIGEIFAREGKIKKARLFFSKAIQIESDHKQARKHNNEY